MIKLLRLGHATFETPDIEKAIEHHIQVIGLSLSSVEPLKVTGSGGQVQDWSLGVSLSGPQPSGSLKARFDSPQGGVSDCDLPIVPRLTFAPTWGSST